MIFKVFYQETRNRNPKREETKSLYMEAKDVVEARTLLEEKSPYNVEHIHELTGNHLEYEKENADFKITEFK